MMVESLTAVHSEAGKNIYDSMAQLIVEIFARRIPSFAYNSDIQRLVSVRESIQKRFPIIESDAATARYELLLPNVTEDAINQLRTAISLLLRDIIDDEGNPKSENNEYTLWIKDSQETSDEIDAVKLAVKRALTEFSQQVGADYDAGLKDVNNFFLTLSEYARLSVFCYIDHGSRNENGRPSQVLSNMYEKNSYVGCAVARDELYPPVFLENLENGRESRAHCLDVMPKMQGEYRLVLCVKNLRKEGFTFTSFAQDDLSKAYENAISWQKASDDVRRIMGEDIPARNWIQDAWERVLDLARRFDVDTNDLSKMVLLVPEAEAERLSIPGIVRAPEELQILSKLNDVYRSDLLGFIGGHGGELFPLNEDTSGYTVPRYLVKSGSRWQGDMDLGAMKVSGLRLVQPSGRTSYFKIYEAGSGGYVSNVGEFKAGDVLFCRVEGEPVGSYIAVIPRAQAERFLDLPAVGTAPSVENDPGIRLG